jgi:Fic/DOC family N-terminal
MAFDPSKPYNDLPALPPRVDVETRAVLKACIEARAAVAELKAAGQLIPNQGVLINSIPLLEAQADGFPIPTAVVREAPIPLHCTAGQPTALQCAASLEPRAQRDEGVALQF